MGKMLDSNVVTREYFDSILVEARYFDSDLPCLETEFFGEKFETPIMSAALSHLFNVCEDGPVKMARQVKEAGALHWTGIGEKKELEDILATGARTVKVIKPHADDRIIFDRIDHACGSGAFAVGMDIDHCFDSRGRYDMVGDLPMRPKTEEQLREYVRRSSRPFIVKGILSVADAKKCAQAGVQGIVVSHHHGILPGAVPPIMILPEIAKAVGDRMTIFADCGFESGLDVFKALALGADGVLVGRELMKHLPAGEDAVTARLREMTGELASVMARCGARSIGQIDPSVLHFWRR